MNSVAPTNKALCKALKMFANAHKDIEIKTLQIIEMAINILKDELQKDLSGEERKDIRDKIFDLIGQVREESKESRNFLSKLVYIAGGVTLVGIGAGVFILTKGKNIEFIVEGAKMVSKVL
jgi:uncharacterized Fe-S cluster-containing radical SAM superfamily enzyme